MVSPRMSCYKASLSRPLFLLSPPSPSPPMSSCPYISHSRAPIRTRLMLVPCSETPRTPNQNICLFIVSYPTFRYSVVAAENGLSYSLASMKINSSFSWGYMEKSKTHSRAMDLAFLQRPHFCILPDSCPDYVFF